MASTKPNPFAKVPAKGAPADKAVKPSKFVPFKKGAK